MNINFIYLHGFSSGPKSTKALFFDKKISKTFNESVLRPDLNQPSFKYLSLQAQLDHVETLFDNRDVFLIASSLGAYVASLLAERHPKKIVSMILMAPAYDFLRQRMKQLDKSILEQWEKNGFIEIDHSYYKKKSKLHFNFLNESKDFEKDDFFFKQKSLIFHGKNDRTAPYTITKKYLEKKINCIIKLVNDNHQLIKSLDEIWIDSKQFINHLMEERK